MNRNTDGLPEKHKKGGIHMEIETATRSLPETYSLVENLDISHNRSAGLILNLAAVVSFLIFGWGMIGLAGAIRPELKGPEFSVTTNNIAGLVWSVVGIIVVTLCVLAVHEAIHALFFWTFTGSRPEFGLSLTYAFTAAPAWYIPRKKYLLIALAPVVLITLGGVTALMVIREDWILGLIFLIAMNFSGSVGDMMVVIKLLRKPAGVLAQDYGHGVRFLCPSVIQS